MQFQKKIIDFQSLALIREENRDKKIVFTNGCFDILHIGHVRCLQKSRALGDMLVVGVNSDKSVRNIKGPTRPIIPQDERMEMLAAYDFVDYVVLFDEDTPRNIICSLKPDVWAKGGDWNQQNLPDAELQNILHYQMVFIDYVNDHSSTKIIQMIDKEREEI